MNKEQFIENLKSLPAYDKVYINNEYSSWEDYDAYIEYVENLDDHCYGMSAIEIIDRFSDIDTSRTFWKDGCYGIDSFDDPDDYIDWDCVADWIIENNNDFDNEDIREWLDELKDDEEQDIPAYMVENNRKVVEERKAR